MKNKTDKKESSKMMYSREDVAHDFNVLYFILKHIALELPNHYKFKDVDEFESALINRGLGIHKHKDFYKYLKIQNKEHIRIIVYLMLNIITLCMTRKYNFSEIPDEEIIDFIYNEFIKMI